MTIVNERVAAHIEGDFVVFLIGARVNRWWKIPQILQVGRAMGRMLDELDRHPSSACSIMRAGRAARRSSCSTGARLSTCMPMPV